MSEHNFEKYSESFNKKNTLRKYFNELLNYLEIPKPKLYIRVEGTSSEGFVGTFSTDKNGSPYVCLWRGGWNRFTVRHEIIHYYQFLCHGVKIWETSGEEDPFEKEAKSLEVLDEASLKMYTEFRRKIADINLEE